MNKIALLLLLLLVSCGEKQTTTEHKPNPVLERERLTREMVDEAYRRGFKDGWDYHINNPTGDPVQQSKSNTSGDTRRMNW